MADITLKAYLAHLDDLLGRRLYEEAEAHCTHVLAKYPKNLSTLRRLAKAQFESGKYQEAERTYTTVLSMEPRSVDSYVGLSWVARQRGQGDQTIALLERAYEQDTNNQDVVQLLRDAHRTFNDRANAKLPQTQFIAARQQWRSGLGQQAVATLNSALAMDPGRADIRLLKMQIHQQAGEGIEAARAATDVLKQLPDCIEANAMLAQFWKAQGRPSDAQRFVTHVEAADPFLAFEIATGQPPPDEALSLSLLDYRTGPSPSTSTDAPDWMAELSKNEPTQMSMPKVESAETFEWLSQAQPVLEDQEPEDRSWLQGAVESSNMPDDLNWLTAAATSDTAGDEEDIFDFAAELGFADESAAQPEMQMDWMQDAEPADEGDTLDSISTKISQEEEKHQEVLSELAALSGDAGSEVPAATAETEDDWMTALTGASSDPTAPEREDFDDFLRNFTSFSELAPEEAAQSSGTGLTGLLSGLSDSEDADHPETAPVSPDIADIDPEDPLAWMRAGISDELPVEEANMLDTQDDGMPAFSDEQQMPDLDALLRDEEFPAEQPASAPVSEMPLDEAETDPFEWMKHHDVEMVGDEKKESLWDDPMGVSDMPSLDQADADPMQWLRDEGVDLIEEVDPEADPLAWAKESGLDLLEDVGTANITQTATLSGEMARMGAEAAETPSPFDELEAGAPEEAPKMTGLLAYMKDAASADKGDSPMSDKEMPDWLNGPEDEEEEPSAAAGDLADFDWMAVTPAEADAEIDWDEAPETEAADEAAPDWLAALDNPVDAAEAAALSAKDDPAVTDMWEDTADDAAIEQPAWMAALRDEPTADEPAEAQEPAEWVFSEGEPAKDEVAAEDMLAATAAAVDESTDWLDAATSAGDQAEPAVSPDDSIDWLDAVVADQVARAAAAAEEEESAGVEESAAEPVVDEAMDWLKAAAPAVDESEAETVQQDDSMDWLSASAPAEAAAESASDDSMDWLAASAPEQASDVQEPVAESAADDSMDWLSAAAPAEANGEAEPVSSAETDDSMDWLGTPSPEDEPVAEASAAGMDWLAADDDGIGDETNAFIAQDSLDWLTETPSADVTDDDAERAVSPEFMGEAGTSDMELGKDFDFNAPELVDDAGQDDADFLRGLEPAAEEEASPSYELSFIEEDESTEDVATVELEGDPLPDWLMEARTDASSLKMDVDVPEDQLSRQSQLSGEILDDADLLEAEPPVEESLNPSAVNSPDWLNAMVPGLDVGSDLPEDVEPAAEAEFLNGGRSDFTWLSQLVDEELAPPTMAAPSRRSARFPFSEPPLWLTTLREETQGASPVLDLDADDDSLPDWLKFDDAETN